MSEQKYDADMERAAMEYQIDLQNGINRTTPNRLFSLEEVEGWKRCANTPAEVQLAFQLADIMRENMRLRELLQELHESMSMEAGYHYSDGETAQEITKLLSNKDSDNV